MNLDRILDSGQGMKRKRHVSSILEAGKAQDLALLALLLDGQVHILRMQQETHWSRRRLRQWLFPKVAAELVYAFGGDVFVGRDALKEELDRALAELPDDRQIAARRALGLTDWPPDDLWRKASNGEKAFFCERYMDSVKAVMDEASGDDRIFDLFAGLLDGKVLSRQAANDAFNAVYMGEARKVFLALKHFLREGIVERKPSGYRLVRHKRLAGPYALKFTGGKPAEKWGRMLAIVE